MIMQQHLCFLDMQSFSVARCYHIIICKLLVDVGILKKSKESILGKLNNATLFEVLCCYICCMVA